MRSIIILSLLFSLCCCHENKKQSIQFKPVSEKELNFSADTTFAIPHGKIWDERKRIHDSCMGSSYAVNAVFMRTRDSFPLGSIVDMKTMKVVKRFPLLNDPYKYLSTVFTFTTRPCYERRPIDVPVDSFMNNRYLFTIDSLNDKINGELIKAARNSIHTEVETGSWLTLELSDALGKILDTTTNQNLLEYKKALLTPRNMILVRSSTVMEVTFYFDTERPLTDALLKKLSGKPFSINRPDFQSQLFYIKENRFELKLTGFFQLMGQFMKCELGQASNL